MNQIPFSLILFWFVLYKQRWTTWLKAKFHYCFKEISSVKHAWISWIPECLTVLLWVVYPGRLHSIPFIQDCVKVLLYLVGFINILYSSVSVPLDHLCLYICISSFPSSHPALYACTTLQCWGHPCVTSFFCNTLFVILGIFFDVFSETSIKNHWIKVIFLWFLS